MTEKIIQLNWNENDISSEIHRHIKENPLRKKWRVSTNVEADIPKDIPKVRGFADKFPRIDFRLSVFSKNEEYEYFFEAKNLKQKSTALKRRYINTGINNFVSKKYQNGSLIGYLLDGEIDKTIDGVNSLLIKDKRNTEILIIKKNKLFEYYYESNHSNIETLKHLIFNFINIAN
ncbi:hypothetical protein [Chryseobacterium sp. CP-77]|uniref:hypothetical protein n=1 Tax=Chryseobacterium sp. CP-77 TaxID=3116594 RepID=UPI002ED5971B